MMINLMPTDWHLPRSQHVLNDSHTESSSLLVHDFTYDGLQAHVMLTSLASDADAQAFCGTE